jgi:hypothetical protein
MSSAPNPTRSPSTDRGQNRKSSKVFRLPFQYLRSIPRPAFQSHNQSMERPILDTLETAQEIEDLNLQIKNLRLQLEFRDMQLRTLRVRLNRYGAIIGIEEAA